MSNRVEELEKTVRELRATVNGLTEELVETKERVRQLEDSAEVQVAHSKDLAEPVTRPGAAGDVGVSVESDEEAKPTGSEEADEAEESELRDGDIIVA